MANDYDKFAALRQQDIRTGKKRSHVCVEKPMMDSMMPTLAGNVLMVGCGTGEESELLLAHGARTLTGIDSSPESIRIAQEAHPDIDFSVRDMHSLNFPEGEFDFVYSSLTVHYSPEPVKVLKEMSRVLKPGGKLLFSVGHPLRWGSEEVSLDGVNVRILGYSQNVDHPQLYGTYASYSEHEHTFPSGEVLKFYSGSPGFYYKLLKGVGFSIDDFQESKVSEVCMSEDPYYFERFSEFPQFMAFAATKL